MMPSFGEMSLYRFWISYLVHLDLGACHVLLAAVIDCAIQMDFLPRYVAGLGQVQINREHTGLVEEPTNLFLVIGSDRVL